MPKIDLEKCSRCMKCEKDCPADVIDIASGTIGEGCIHCGHCVAICDTGAMEPDLGSIVPLGSDSLSPIAYTELVAANRSCRNYAKKDISDEVIRSLVENMKHYPSASNARPVKITVVRTSEKIQELNDRTVDTFIKTLKTITNPWLKPIIKVLMPSMNIKGLNKYKTQFEEKQKTNRSQVCHHAPVVLLFHGESSKFGMTRDDVLIWATHSSAFAHTLGLGTCFIGFIVKAMERNKEMRRAFQIPDGHMVYAALTVGYPKLGYKNETSRQAPEYTIL